MTDDLSARFEQAATQAKALPTRPSNEDMLTLYALYKQGASGDVTGERPGFMDFVGGAKYDAWKKLAGMSREEAMKKYIAKVTALKG
jgi:acyl-CoA-binding protein